MRLNVSILVICYEQEDFIEETLLSAVNQGPGVEIVVADDCSKDGTCDVVEAVARGSETPIRLIRGGQNVGITGNCNRGLAACRGELLAMLGGDDLMYPGKVAKQREWMAMSHDRVLCGHDAEHFDSETGETLYLSSDRTTFLPQETGAAALCRGEAYYAGSSAMLRRAAMPSQGFDERLHMVSDRKMYIDTVGPRGVHGVIPGVWSRYRLHRRNVSHTRRQRMFEELAMTYRLAAEEHPRFSVDCARGLARTYYTYGVWEIGDGDVREGRKRLVHSMKGPAAIRMCPKTIGWFALSYLPGGVRSWALGRRTRT